MGPNVGRNNMRASWTTGRAIGLALSLLLLGFGVKCLFDGRRIDRDFERWKTAKPMDGVVDFSAPGRFVLPFEQICSSIHGETVALRVPPEVLLGTTTTQLLVGLNARLEITDKSGHNLVESAGSKAIWGEQTLDGAIPVFGIAPFRKGAYEATITVVEGAPALKGITQRVEGRYLLCGLERLPATILSGVGIVSAGIGSVAGVIVLFLVARSSGFPRIDQHQGDSPNGGPAEHPGNLVSGGGLPSVS